MIIIEQRKKRIQDLLEGIIEDKILAGIEAFLQQLVQPNKALFYAKPMKNQVDISALKKEQNYQTQNLRSLSGILEEEASFEELVKYL